MKSIKAGKISSFTNPFFNRYKAGLTALICTALTPMVMAQTTTNFTTAGNATWTCPSNVFSVQVETTGGGGGGGGALNSSGVSVYGCAGGGAGGSYVRYTVGVTPGTVYNLTVGAGGLGGTNTTTIYYTGNTGGSSYFGNSTAGNSSGAMVLSVGGPGGGGFTNGVGANNTRIGGIAGGVGTTSGNIPSSGAAADTAGTTGGTSVGGAEGTAQSGAGGAGAGSSGSSGGGAGGAAVVTTGSSTQGNLGTAPGGGGSGAANLTLSKAGGAGGAGKVALTYTAAIPTAANSTVSASPASVPADGASTSTITVTLKDANGDLIAGKTVTVASSRGATDTISPASVISSSSGVATFTVKSSTGGSAVLTATDTTDSVAVTQTATVSFVAANVSYFTVTPSVGSATAGQVFTATVQAYNSGNMAITDSSLNGITVTMTSSGLAQFDANGDGIYGDNTQQLTNGTLTINVRDLKAESVTLTATAGAATGTSSSVTIGAAPFAQLQLLLPGETAAPGTASGKTGTASAETSGASFNFTVNSVDTNWNVVSSSDTVHVAAGSDALAVLPANTALSGGTVTLSASNIVAGAGKTLVASDVSNGGITAGTSSTYLVVPGSAYRLLTLAPGESATFGSSPGKTGSPINQTPTVAYSVTVDALDANYNLATNNGDTVSIKSSDATATLPANAALVGGTKSFTLTNNEVGTFAIVATNISNSGVISGSSTVTTTNIATTTTLTSSLNPVFAGQAFKLTATVSGAGAHTGTVTFKNGSTNLATVPLSGSTSTYTASGAVGTYSITAVYNGDSNNLVSTSSVLSEIIQSGPAAASAASLMQDGQDYTVDANGLTSATENAPWTLEGASTTVIIGVISGNLTGTSSNAAALAGVSGPLGTAAHLIVGASPSSVREFYRPLSNNVTSGSVYFSFLLDMGAVVTNSDEVVLTMLAGGTSNAPSGLIDTDPLSMHVRMGSATTNYNLGVERLAGTTAWATNNLSVGSTYLVVLEYTFGGTCQLFLDPQPGTAQPAASATTAPGGTDPASIGTVLIYEGDSPFQTSGAGVATNTSDGFNYDVMRADTSWLNVTPSVQISAGAAALAFTSAPQTFSINDGTPGLVTVTLLDQSNNVYTAVSNLTIALSSSSTGGSFISSIDDVTVLTNVVIAAGSSTVSFYYNDSIAGSPVITASSGLLAPASQTETVNPPAGLLAYFTVTPSVSSTPAGSVFTATIQAYDTNGVPIENHSADGLIVTLTSSGLAKFDANGDGVYGDNTKALTNGTFTINVLDPKAESVTLTAALGTNTGTSAAIAITPDVAAQLQLLLPGESAAPGTTSGKTGTAATEISGTPYNIVVNLVDTNWNVISSSDTVHIAATGDASAMLPANTSLSGGSATLGVTDIIAGSGYTLTASDVSNGSIASSTSAAYSVVPGAVAKLVLLAPGETATPNVAPGKTGMPNGQLQGVPFTLTVDAFDANYNLVTASSDTVGITSGDALATLPGNATLASGTKTFTIVQNTAGTIMDTASDITSGSVSTGTTTVSVSPVPKYMSVQSGNWESASTWAFSYDGVTWIPATNTPTYLNADVISITNGYTVTITSPEDIDQTVVSTNSILAISNGITVTVNDGFGTDLDVFGTVDNAGTISQATGTATVVFESASTYLHDQDEGSIVTATWATNANCNIVGWKVGTGVSISTGLKQKFGNFTWNSTNQTSILSMGTSPPTNFSGNFNVISTGTGELAICLGATVNLNIGGNVNVSGGFLTAATTGSGTEIVNVAGNVNVSGGTFDLESDATGSEVVTWNLSGDLNLSGGVFTAVDTNTRPVLNFVKPGVQKLTITGSGSIGSTSTINWSVTNGSTLDLNTAVVPGKGSFTVYPGGGLETAKAGGFAANLTVTSTNISLSHAASYTYDGSVAQSGDTLLPGTVYSLTVSNIFGVTLAGAETATNLSVDGSLSGSTITLPGGGNLTATAPSTISGNVNLNSSGLVLIASSNTLPGLNIQSGTMTLGGGPITLTVQGSPIIEGGYLLVGASSGGAVAGTVPLSVTANGAGFSPPSVITPQIIGGELYINTTEFLALYDAGPGFFSGENVILTNASGLQLYVWYSTDSSLAVSNWTSAGQMQEQSLNDNTGRSYYSLNLNPVVSPTYYVAGSANSGPYLFSPVPAGTLTTADFENFTLNETNAGISATGVLAFSTISAPSIPASGLVYASSGFQLQFSGTSGQGYTLQASTNLTTWTNIATGTFGASPVTFTDTNAAAYPLRFYRVFSP